MIYLLLSMTLFLSPNDPCLNEESAHVCPCDIPSSEIQEIIDTMVQIAYGETIDQTKSILVGLAAPQIGIQKRIILVDTAATGVFDEDTESPPQIQEFINPEILWKSEEQTVWLEGCFSTSRICGILPRSERVIIRAYDRDGNIATQEYNGYLARIFQHEIDHLDGIRFPDRISDDNFLHWVEENEITEYRINWQNWTKKFARERWLEMKNLPKSYESI